MKHLYFFYATFDYFDEALNFRHGEISGVIESERQITSGDDYYRWEERTRAMVGEDHRQAIRNFTVKSFSYLGGHHE